MKGINQYIGKFVKLIDNNNKVHMGYVSDYDDEIDNDNGIPSIDLDPCKNAGCGTFFYENEIQSIEEMSEKEVIDWNYSHDFYEGKR